MARGPTLTDFSTAVNSTPTTVSGPPQFVLPSYLYDGGGPDFDDPETGFRVINDPDAVIGLLRAGAGVPGPPPGAAVWGPVERCIGRQAVVALRPAISRIALSLVADIIHRVDPAETTGRLDLVTDFALPLVAHVLNHVVGFDAADIADAAADFGGCANLLAQAFPEPDEHLWPNRDVLLELLGERGLDRAVGEGAPPAGLMTQLLEAQNPDAVAPLKAFGVPHGAAPMPITETDILAAFSVIGSLGGAAAAAALATTVALVDHAGRLEDVHLRPEQVVPSAVAEALRCQPPRPLVRIDPPPGTPAHQPVAVAVAAAHRKPDWYPNPEEYRPERGLRSSDLQLGLGVCHFLVVAQVEVGLTALATRLPGLRTHPVAARRWPASIPAALSLPCTFDAAGARRLGGVPS